MSTFSPPVFCLLLDFGKSLGFRDLGFTPSHRRRLAMLLWVLLTSHGKLYSAFCLLTSRVRETSPGKNKVFLSTYLPHLLEAIPCSFWISACLAALSLLPASMRFLSVRPEICLHLPSDPASRRSPLVFGYTLPAAGRVRDFHPLDFAHAGRTKPDGSDPRGMTSVRTVSCE